MLVLSRKTNEKIIIGDHVTVTVIEVRGDKVRLGFEAPRHTPVHRHEVHERIEAERKPEAGRESRVESQEPEGETAT
ncbi:MAG: carbon storage regulator CsrA [Pirellulales bacterium]|nr:carbon storage regulator CsrA [Pirellulales bacterium]